MARKKGTLNKQLPPEARKLLEEAIDYMAPLAEAIQQAESAGVDVKDALEWAGICHQGIQARALRFFPDLAFTE